MSPIERVAEKQEQTFLVKPTANKYFSKSKIKCKNINIPTLSRFLLQWIPTIQATISTQHVFLLICPFHGGECGNL